MLDSWCTSLMISVFLFKKELRVKGAGTHILLGTTLTYRAHCCEKKVLLLHSGACHHKKALLTTVSSHSKNTDKITDCKTDVYPHPAVHACFKRLWDLSCYFLSFCNTENEWIRSRLGYLPFWGLLPSHSCML